MKHISFFALLLSVAIVGCDPAANQQPTQKYEEKKASLGDMEKDSPLKFLKVTGSNHGNLLNQTVVEGDVTNRATLTTYKNIQLQITFKDKDGSVIEKQKETLDDEVKPGGTINYKIKTGHIKGVDDIAVIILKATAE